MARNPSLPTSLFIGIAVRSAIRHLPARILGAWNVNERQPTPPQCWTESDREQPLQAALSVEAGPYSCCLIASRSAPRNVNK